MTARRPPARPGDTSRDGKPPRLAIHDPAALARARMIQIALERHRRRIAAAKQEGGGHDGAP